MKQVIKFKSPENHYKADACVVWCFDDRFSKLLEETKKVLNLNKIDLIKIAGGAKGIADGEDATDFIFDQISKSLKLHKPSLILLMVHKDCGAYGKLEVADEIEFFTEQLKKARHNLTALLRKNDYKVLIRTYFADFDGLNRVD